MKETEKERRYNEALERARKLQETCDNTAVIGWCEYIFPELKESEDEKMMNQLYSWMKEFGGAEEYTEKVYQWIKGLLEKHKYTEDDLDKAYKCADEVQYRRGYEDAKKEIVKQDEQKPIISDDALREGIAHFGITQYQIDNWLKKYVEVEKLEQKPADKIKQECHCNGVREPKEATGVLKQLINEQKSDWSEDDEYNREHLLGWINTLKTYIHHDALVSIDLRRNRIDEVTKFENWFKSIKDRVQPQQKQEWSEEDKVKINRIVAFLENLNLKSLNIIDDNNIFKKDIDWLKSLKERYTCKPSEEQMDALETAISSLQSTALESLYNGLKKL